MAEHSKSQIVAALLNSAAINDGKPDIAGIARDAGLKYSQVRGYWRREKAKQLKRSGREAPVPTPPVPVSLPPPAAGRPPKPDPATCTELQFYEWRVRDLTYDLEQAAADANWNSVAGLSKQLAENRAALERAREAATDTSNIEDDEEFLRRIELALFEQPAFVWHHLVQLCQDRFRARFVIPREDGKASMLLEPDGWRPTGPAVPWSKQFALGGDGE